MTADSPVHFLQTLKKDDLERLAEQSVTTIKELGEAEKETIMLARGGVEGEGFDAYRGGKFRHICPHKGRAERVLKTCAIAPDTIDGQGEEEGGAKRSEAKRRDFLGGESRDKEEEARLEAHPAVCVYVCVCVSTAFSFCPNADFLLCPLAPLASIINDLFPPSASFGLFRPLLPHPRLFPLSQTCGRSNRSTGGLTWRPTDRRKSTTPTAKTWTGATSAHTTRSTSTKSLYNIQCSKIYVH